MILNSQGQSSTKGWTLQCHLEILSDFPIIISILINICVVHFQNPAIAFRWLVAAMATESVGRISQDSGEDKKVGVVRRGWSGGVYSFIRSSIGRPAESGRPHHN